MIWPLEISRSTIAPANDMVNMPIIDANDVLAADFEALIISSVFS